MGGDGSPKPIPRWDVHFGGFGDDREDSTAPHITFRPQMGGPRQCGLAMCTFHLGFSLGINARVFSVKAVCSLLRLCPRTESHAVIECGHNDKST